MSSECRPRDCYDLCTRPIIKVRRVRVEESQDEMEARTKENERSRSLAEISNTLREVLNKNDILVSGINLGTHRLLQAADDTASLALRTRPLASGPGRPNTDFDEAVIRSRLVSATYLAEVLVDSLKQINEAILQSSINSARPSQKPTVEEPTVFYRVCLKNSYTSHNVDLGFWSARGLPDHDFHKPSDYEFQTHTGGHHHLADPDDKCGGITFNSPYISLTTDPGRAFNIGQRNKRNRLGGLHHEVYHIDAAKLRKMKIVTERTTDLATQWDIPYLGSGADRLEYVTDSHWLARFWIPAECIIGKIPFSDFEELCTEHGVVNRDANFAVGGKLLPADAFEKNSHPPIPVEIIYDSDDEPPVNVSPPKPDVPKPKSADDDHDEPNEQSSPPSPINAEISPPKLPTLPTSRKAQRSKAPPASPPKAEVTPSKRPAGRPVRPRKPVAVNDAKVTENPTPVQNPPSVEAELERGIQALELSDG